MFSAKYPWALWVALPKTSVQAWGIPKTSGHSQLSGRLQPIPTIAPILNHTGQVHHPESYPQSFHDWTLGEEILADRPKSPWCGPSKFNIESCSRSNKLQSQGYEYSTSRMLGKLRARRTNYPFICARTDQVTWKRSFGIEVRILYAEDISHPVTYLTLETFVMQVLTWIVLHVLRQNRNCHRLRRAQKSSHRVYGNFSKTRIVHVFVFGLCGLRHSLTYGQDTLLGTNTFYD